MSEIQILQLERGGVYGVKATLEQVRVKKQYFYSCYLTISILDEGYSSKQRSCTLY
jgi:hypothetical protein